MSYGMNFFPQHPLPAKKAVEPEPAPDPTCTDCPHPAWDHNGDGWGVDDQGPFDWFRCPECDCRVKGHLHIKEANPLFPTSNAEMVASGAGNPFGMYAGMI